MPGAQAKEQTYNDTTNKERYCIQREASQACCQQDTGIGRVKYYFFLKDLQFSGEWGGRPNMYEFFFWH